jgi:hypothetical protein
MEGSTPRRRLRVAHYSFHQGEIELEESLDNKAEADGYLRRCSCWMYRWVRHCR